VCEDISEGAIAESELPCEVVIDAGDVVMGEFPIQSRGIARRIPALERIGEQRKGLGR